MLGNGHALFMREIVADVLKIEGQCVTDVHCKARAAHVQQRHL